MEKLTLFGFKKVSEMIKEGCVDSIKEKLSTLSISCKKKIINAKWTKVEKEAIKLWLK